MNKKLFSWKALAGVALLAAFSMTSCTSDDPIDPTNPSGINPTSLSHQVGGTYDWEATVKKYSDLKDFFAADATKLQDAIKDKKNITVCVNLVDYVIAAADGKAGDGVIVVPDFWKGDGTGANGKVVNIIVNGNYKNADFERKNAIAKNDVAADMSNFPVKLDVDQLKGAEVNFTFGEQKFDLYLQSELARTTVSGLYTIGYMYGKTAEKLSSFEVKSGTVEALDATSTGDFKGISGIWNKAAGTPVFTCDAANGFALGTNGYSVANNVFVETDMVIDAEYNFYGWKAAQLGTVKFVKKATITLPFKESKIESIIGTKAADCKVYTGGNATDLKNIGAMEKVTVYNDVTLTQDVYTDVIFYDEVTFSSDKVAAFDKVTFNDDLNVYVAADNTELTFNGVNFNDDVKMLSGIMKENASAYTIYSYYQWVIDNADPTQGEWVMYKTDWGYINLTNAQKEIKEYNKDKEVVEYSWDDVYMSNGWNTVNGGQLGANPGKNPDLSKATNLIKIGTFVPAGVVTIIPEGTKVTMDKDCKFNGSQTDAELNDIWGDLGDSKETWYDVTFAGKAYVWKRIQYPGAGTMIYWSLIPAE